MPKRAIAAAGFLLWMHLPADAQRSASTSLIVQVRPEARVAPQQVPLQFRVTADGAADVTFSTAEITAMVRSAPGQQIHVTARLDALNGPDGPVPGAAVQWKGANDRATGGGQQATCSSGDFASGAAGDLVSGWQRSGSLTCTVAFQLADPRILTPGAYSGTVTLLVEAR